MSFLAHSRKSLLKKPTTGHSKSLLKNSAIQDCDCDRGMDRSQYKGCTRLHIDEYDEYYSQFMTVSRQNAQRGERIKKLVKDIRNLKEIIRKKEERIKSLDVAVKDVDSNRGRKGEGKSREKTPKCMVKELSFSIFDEKKENIQNICDIKRYKDFGIQTLTESEFESSSASSSYQEDENLDTVGEIGTQEIPIKLGPAILSQPLNESDKLNPLDPVSSSLKPMQHDLFKNLDTQTQLRKKSSSMKNRMIPRGTLSLKDYETSIMKMVKENMILEKKVKKQMKMFTKENKEMRTNMMKGSFDEADTTGNEKIHRQNAAKIERLSSHDEEKFEEILEEKEKELEKMHNMNASYRAQLIDLKIAISKSRDLGRFSNHIEENEIRGNLDEFELEQAKETIVNLEDKVKELESIIETFRSQQ
ncbi:unnamed protein product [Moneuplotes crassus]|uniref:Uncharacterized protein n=1 Tax=Euplotes crassus TaxID=5936 RepID=A0AAD1UB13_EUPCR|nr:unnamed protein product [Moneuplotes crassus]